MFGQGRFWSALRVIFWMSTIVPCLIPYTESSTCIAPNQESTVKFTVNSHQNKTGHWILQVDHQRTGGTGGTTDNPWLLEIKRRTITSCTGEETVTTTLIANLTTTQHTFNSSQASGGPNQTEVELPTERYKLHDEQLTWSEAKDVCEQEGRQLFVIDSNNEKELVKTFAKKHHFIWSGVYEQDTKYWTVSGRELAKDKIFWSPGEPNDNFPNNCLSMYTVTGGLADFMCNAPWPFLCELK